jgi:hypothetical protein
MMRPPLRRLPPHQREGGTGNQKGTVHVHVDHSPEFLRTDLVDRAREKADARVVEDHIKPAKPRLQRGKQPIDEGLVADIAGKTKRPRGWRAGAGQCFVEGVQPAPCQNNLCPGFKEGNRSSPANAGAGTRDENGLFRQGHVRWTRCCAGVGTARRGQGRGLVPLMQWLAGCGHFTDFPYPYGSAGEEAAFIAVPAGGRREDGTHP